MFRFWASVCHVKDPFPPRPPPTLSRYYYKEPHMPCLNQRDSVRAGLIFPSWVGTAEFTQPRAHMTWALRFLVLFYTRSKWRHCRGNTWSKTQGKNNSPGIQFFLRIFLMKRFLNCKFSKKARSYMTWAVEDRLTGDISWWTLADFFLWAVLSI